MTTTLTASRSTGKTIADYVPLPKQAIFHTCPADYVLFGGAAGGSKSYALMCEDVITCLEQPDETVLVTRRELNELRELILMTKFLCSIEARTGRSTTIQGCFWGEKAKIMTFPNGSRIVFDHLIHEDSVESHQGVAYSMWSPDEWTQLTPYQTNFMRTRLRSSNPNAWVRIRGASNPGNVSHQMIKDMFVSPPDTDAELIAYFDFQRAESLDVSEYGDAWGYYPEGTRGMPEEFVVWRPDMDDEMRAANALRVSQGLQPMAMPSRCFIKSLLSDNPYYYETPHYHAALMANPDKSLREAMLDGNWDLFEGMFFNEWNPSIHVVDPISIPDYWTTVWGGLDQGFAAPTCHLWGVQNPETNQVVIYDELYASRMTDSMVCREIKGKRSERLLYSAADPVVFQPGSADTGFTTADLYERHGVHLTPGRNNRPDGWRRVRDLLSVNPVTGQPGLVVTRNCTNLIREMAAAVYDKHKTEDLDTRGSDHALDALRYLCMARNTRAASSALPLSVATVHYG